MRKETVGAIKGVIFSLLLSFVGCAQEQAEQPEEAVTDAEPSAHESVKGDGADSYSPYTKGLSATRVVW